MVALIHNYGEIVQYWAFSIEPSAQEPKLPDRAALTFYGILRKIMYVVPTIIFLTYYWVSHLRILMRAFLFFTSGPNISPNPLSPNSLPHK